MTAVTWLDPDRRSQVASIHRFRVYRLLRHKPWYSHASTEDNAESWSKVSVQARKVKPHVGDHAASRKIFGEPITHFTAIMWGKTSCQNRILRPIADETHVTIPHFDVFEDNWGKCGHQFGSVTRKNPWGSHQRLKKTVTTMTESKCKMIFIAMITGDPSPSEVRFVWKQNICCHVRSLTERGKILHRMNAFQIQGAKLTLAVSECHSYATAALFIYDV
jgi:hypothetical protein